MISIVDRQHDLALVLIETPTITVCITYSPAMASVNTNRIPLHGVNWATWHYCFRKRYIHIFTPTNLFTRRIRWWLAAVVGLILLSVSLSLSIPGVFAARRERSRLECKPIDGNRDIYGIGTRIAAYAQGLMTIFGEVYTTDPKHTAALTSVNLWFLWALIIAAYFCNDNTYQDDGEMLKALGDTISYINLGALLLPTKNLERESVFTRLMRWVTFFVWHTINPTVGRRDGKSSHLECEYDWFFLVYNRVEIRGRPRLAFNLMFGFGAKLLGVPLLALRILIYVAKFPHQRINAALDSCKDTLGSKKHSRAKVWADILFIYPVGDIMALIDAVSYSSTLFST